MMSHGATLTNGESVECKRIIEKYREHYSWNKLAEMLGVSRMPHFRQGHGSIGQVLKMFHAGAPTLELYKACVQLDSRLSREKNKVNAKNTINPAVRATISSAVIKKVEENPGISRGKLSKSLSADTAVVRSVIHSMIREGELVDKYPVTARRSELRVPNGTLVTIDTTLPVSFAEIVNGSTAPPSADDPEKSGAPEQPSSPSWDSIRAKLLSAADDIKQMGVELSYHAALPAAMTRDMQAVFATRHDKLIKFIEEELE